LKFVKKVLKKAGTILLIAPEGIEITAQEAMAFHAGVS
jgi:hypothetical protein